MNNQLLGYALPTPPHPTITTFAFLTLDIA